jgi:hypothetical protein
LSKTSELGWAINAHIIGDTYYHDHCLLFIVCSSAELSFAFITTTLEGAAVVYTNTSVIFFWSYMTQAWGMLASFVHSFLFYTPHGRSGPTGSFFPPNGLLWMIPLLLSLTTTFSVEETLMDFGYTYSPNFIHQGEFVITKISSAHGYKNSASSNSDEFIHGPKLIPRHS